MSDALSLSVVIITYNESRNIAACIESVLGLADEILVVDSFSTDDTVAIARRFRRSGFTARIQRSYRAKELGQGPGHPYICS